MTGIMDNALTAGLLGHNYLAQVLEHLRVIAVETNKQIADLLGIKPSAAITCVKPVALYLSYVIPLQVFMLDIITTIYALYASTRKTLYMHS